jgi:Fe2+ or Zn2+ uptake regulation protein
MPKKTRMTKQRKAILEVLKNTDSHPTADSIYDEVKKNIPNISLGTVYRNLNVLHTMGKIMILDYGGTYSRFDGNPENHYHFHCEECGQLFDINHPVMDEIDKTVEDDTSFTVNFHRLEFYGLCNKCKNDKNNIN